jgi:hypothetical protein
MAIYTLAELAKRAPEELEEGVIENIIDVNPINQVLPYVSYTGTGLTVNHENVLGSAQFLAVDGTITAKAPTTYTSQTFKATTIIGDVEANGLLAAEGASVDETATQINRKAKSVGRQFQTGMATGDGAGANMNSLHSLCDASQFTTASAGQSLSFPLLDELLMLVTLDDPDFIVMPKRTFTAFRALFVAAGGVTPDYLRDQFGKAAGLSVMDYLGVPVFRNDFLSITETANGAALTTGALASVYAGCFDDGSRQKGIAAIYPEAVEAGVVVEGVGAMEAKDTSIIRVKQYVNLANFGVKGLARLTSINN